MIGPFPNGSSSDRAQDFASARETDYLGLEDDGESPAPADGRAHVWQGETYTWRSVASPTDMVDLTEAYGALEDVTVYAWTKIEATTETHAVLGIGSDDGVQVWLNGDLVHDRWVARGVLVDGDIVRAPLRAGKNSVVLKVGNGEGGWGFAARFLGPASAGAALFQTDDEVAVRALLEMGADVDTTGGRADAVARCQRRGREGQDRRAGGVRSVCRGRGATWIHAFALRRVRRPCRRRVYTPEPRRVRRWASSCRCNSAASEPSRGAPRRGATPRRGGRRWESRGGDQGRAGGRAVRG